MSVFIKLAHNGEIARVHCDATLASVTSAATSTFGIQGPLRLSFVDDEGDACIISTTSALTDALANVPSGRLPKLVVTQEGTMTCLEVRTVAAAVCG